MICLVRDWVGEVLPLLLYYIGTLSGKRVQGQDDWGTGEGQNPMLVPTYAQTLAKRKKTLSTRLGRRLDPSLCHAIGKNKNASKREYERFRGTQFILKLIAKKIKKLLTRFYISG